MVEYDDDDDDDDSGGGGGADDDDDRICQDHCTSYFILGLSIIS
jgi:hypothetical protein